MARKYAKRISRAEIARLMDKFKMTREDIRIAIIRFHLKKSLAKGRKIPFFFILETWLDKWIRSGHYHEYGRGADDYCMARGATRKTHDTGVYEYHNVRIITNRENNREGSEGNSWNIGRRLSKKTRAKVSQSLIGNQRARGSRHTKKWRAKASARMMGNDFARGHRWTEQEKLEIGERSREAARRRKQKSKKRG